MASSPKTVRDVITQELIRVSALPSNLIYGKAIYRREAVEFIRREAGVIEGWAGGLDGTVKEGAGQRRRVTFALDKEGLHWNCSGNPKNHQIFCKHCVALALAIKSSRPGRRARTLQI